MSAVRQREPSPPACNRGTGLERRRLALFIHDLGGGGSQRRALTLAGAFAERAPFGDEARAPVDDRSEYVEQQPEEYHPGCESVIVVYRVEIN